MSRSVVLQVILMVATAAQAVRGAAVSAGDDDGGFPADVIATVGDAPILRGDLRRVLGRLGSAAEMAGPAKRLQLEAAALEQLIDERLLRGEIAQAQIPVTEDEIDAGVGRLREQMAARGQDWDAFLVRAGFDEEALREQVALEVGLDKFVRSQLREERLAAAFARHRRKVDGTRLRVSHILLRPDTARGEEAVAETLERAAAIRAEVLQAFLTFAEAAQRYSAGPSRARGGDLGWITRQAPMVDEFSRQAFEMGKGDISRPFVTPFGIHLLQVTDAAPGQRAADAVRKDLLTLLAADVVRETVARARAATPITYAEGVVHFDPATPADGQGARRIIGSGGVVVEGADR